MNIFSWSIDLTWALVGAVAGFIIEKLFDKRMLVILSASLGVASLLFVIFPFSSLGAELQKRYVDVLIGCFTGSVVSLLWHRLQMISDTNKILAIAFYITIFISAAYVIIFTIKVFRYYYGYDPSYRLTDLVLILSISFLYLSVSSRLTRGPVSIKDIFIMSLLISFGALKLLLQFYVLFEIIGLLFVKDFNMSWILTIVAFLLCIGMAWAESAIFVEPTLKAYNAQRAKPQTSQNETT